MSLQHPVIAVIGAGAVGGYYGARMAQHGRDVHLLVRSDYPHIRRHGMRIQSRDGDFSLLPGQINIYDDPRAMPKADLIVVTIKTTANARLEELVGPMVKTDSVILTLQNGLGNEQLLAELFGEHRVLGGVAFVCINRTGPGEISHTDHGMIRLGEMSGGPSDRAQAVAAHFSDSGVPCHVLADLAHGRWEKLIWNVPFNGMGAALDMTTDRLIASGPGVTMVRRLMQEVIDTCKPLGIRFEASIIDQKIQHTRSMGAYKTSMQIDRQMCRPTEVESILGEPLRMAEHNSVSTPCMKMLYEIVNLLENDRMAEHGVPQKECK
jgi:2-dehydropantoate 2-reductase